MGIDSITEQLTVRNPTGDWRINLGDDEGSRFPDEIYLVDHYAD